MIRLASSTSISHQYARFTVDLQTKKSKTPHLHKIQYFMSNRNLGKSGKHKTIVETNKDAILKREYFKKQNDLVNHRDYSRHPKTNQQFNDLDSFWHSHKSNKISPKTKCRVLWIVKPKVQWESASSSMNSLVISSVLNGFVENWVSPPFVHHEYEFWPAASNS